MPITKDYLASLAVMPVVVIDDASDAVPIANALLEGGIKSIEVTLRTPAALDAIKAIKQECSEIELGVGTVITPKQLESLADIGVDFAVSPGFTPELIATAEHLSIPLLPGVATPSEVMQAMAMGLECFKLFPAVAVGGIPLLKSLQSPLPQATFCPTGGLTIDNFTDFLALGNVACVGGSWLVPQGLVREKNWDGITDIAKKTLERLSVQA